MILMRNDLLPLIDGTKLHPCAINLTTQKAWKLINNKARSNIVLNLSDAHIEIIKPHKIIKIMWDAFKFMYEHLDKATIVVLKKKIPNWK